MASSDPASSRNQTKRRIRVPKRAGRGVKKQVRASYGRLPSAWHIFKTSILHLIRHKRLYGGIGLVYLILSVLLVKGLGNGLDLTETKDALNDLFQESGGQIVSGFALFGILIGSAGTASGEVASMYQSILLLIVSLAVIWALRQSYASKTVSAKAAFYNGMYPLIPGLLVLLVIGIQLLPIAIAGGINTLIIAPGLAITIYELVFWLLLMFGLITLSLYMLASSLFALYIVTLPNTSPLEALRASSKLVRLRRWTILRKILFLPFALLLVLALIMLPIILVATPAAEWVFFVLSIASVLVVHSYLYALYRELL